jgi:hypothetical protein
MFLEQTGFFVYAAGLPWSVPLIRNCAEDRGVQSKIESHRSRAESILKHIEEALRVSAALAKPITDPSNEPFNPLVTRTGQPRAP